jgi:hypothetical protein
MILDCVANAKGQMEILNDIESSEVQWIRHNRRSSSIQGGASWAFTLRTGQTVLERG